MLPLHIKVGPGKFVKIISVDKSMTRVSVQWHDYYWRTRLKTCWLTVPATSVPRSLCVGCALSLILSMNIRWLEWTGVRVGVQIHHLSLRHLSTSYTSWAPLHELRPPNYDNRCVLNMDELFEKGRCFWEKQNLPGISPNLDRAAFCFETKKNGPC